MNETIQNQQPLPHDMIKALEYLAPGGRGATSATRWIARACGHPLADLGTTRRMLAKMRQCGLVEGVTSGGKIFWWHSTEAGRAALAAHQGK